MTNYDFVGEPVVVFFEPGTRSALDSFSFRLSKEIGATGVFAPFVDGQRLTFEFVADDERGTIRDVETGSTWSILGRAVDGPLTGSKLERLVHQDHFWFAWAAFKPDTLIYQGAK